MNSLTLHPTDQGPKVPCRLGLKEIMGNPRMFKWFSGMVSAQVLFLAGWKIPSFPEGKNIASEQFAIENGPLFQFIYLFWMDPNGDFPSPAVHLPEAIRWCPHSYKLVYNPNNYRYNYITTINPSEIVLINKLNAIPIWGTTLCSSS